LLLGIVLASSFIILSLVFIFLIKGRSHEIGIWLSFGYTKKNIISQMIWESLLVSFVALLLSTVAIPPVISGVQSYFNSQMVVNVNDVEDLPFGEQLSPSVDMDEQITLSVSMSTIIEATIIIIVLVVISNTIAMIPILRLKPREIFARLS